MQKRSFFLFFFYFFKTLYSLTEDEPTLSLVRKPLALTLSCPGEKVTSGDTDDLGALSFDRPKLAKGSSPERVILFCAILSSLSLGNIT